MNRMADSPRNSTLLPARTRVTGSAVQGLATKFRVVFALGLQNVGRVALYRLRLRLGLHPVQRVLLPPASGTKFFRPPVHRTVAVPQSHLDAPLLFGWLELPLDVPPDWHANVVTGAAAGGRQHAWWTIPDFDVGLGDIKAVWEPSRFGWVVSLAQLARAGAPESVERLNEWLENWRRFSPAYLGHNWKCGQEASFRVMQLAVAAIILDQVGDVNVELSSLVALHLQRIAPTMAYAVAQNNNHGTSEAAALFIGGSWLTQVGEPRGKKWAALGRYWLEERARRLIERDGSFSQYSVNYHRLMLETYCLAEVWRRKTAEDEFSPALKERLASASEWLRAMTDAGSGDAPNLGANDGAHLLALTAAPFRDFRPAVQLATTLFCNASAYRAGSLADDHLRWLDVAASPALLPATSDAAFPHGGYAVLGNRRARAVIRIPNFRFRPSHADALHVDLWVDGECRLRDGGSYSYADAGWNAYFTGTESHNTVQFDGRDQMSRVGRFLWGDWVRARWIEPVTRLEHRVRAGARYTDRRGATHMRRVALDETEMVVTDSVSGFRTCAVLRWRLAPGNWVLSGHLATNGTDRLTVTSDVEIARIELTTGWESPTYLKRSQIPVLEVEVHQTGTLTSRYEWGT